MARFSNVGSHGLDKIVTYKGKRLVRRLRALHVSVTGRGARSEALWQAADASRDWGYWYSTRREAFENSGACDRPVAP